MYKRSHLSNSKFNTRWNIYHLRSFFSRSIYTVYIFIFFQSMKNTGWGFGDKYLYNIISIQTIYMWSVHVLWSCSVQLFKYLQWHLNNRLVFKVLTVLLFFVVVQLYFSYVLYCIYVIWKRKHKWCNWFTDCWNSYDHWSCLLEGGIWSKWSIK